MTLWGLRRTDNHGGGGQDLLLGGEWRPSRGSHTALRFSYGAEHNTIDAGNGTPRSDVDGDGVTGSLGLSQELSPMIGPGRVVLTAELWFPPGSGGPITMQGPALSVGVGFRAREFHEIRFLPGARR